MIPFCRIYRTKGGEKALSELDTKQKVLVAIYSEYQKDEPSMEENITAVNLGISYDVFKIALNKLDNEGFIKGVKYAKVEENRIINVYTKGLMMTRDGINYVEEKLGILPTMSSSEKLKEVTKKVTTWGYEELKDFVVKVTAEVIKS